MITAIIVTILIYMLLTTINLIIKDIKGENINIGEIFLGGVFTWLIMLINLTIRKTKKLIKKSKYKSLIEDKNGNIYWCNFDKVEKFRETTELDFTRKDFSEYFEYWDKSMCAFDRPNVRYAPKIVWKQYPKYKGE